MYSLQTKVNWLAAARIGGLTGLVAKRCRGPGNLEHAKAQSDQKSSPVRSTCVRARATACACAGVPEELRGCVCLSMAGCSDLVSSRPTWRHLAGR